MKEITVRKFGVTPTNETVNQYTFSNKNGLTISIISLGGIVQSLLTPDRNGKMEDIVLGFDNLDDYVNRNHPYFGAIIGRFGNRIADGKFFIDSNEYVLAKNAGENHLHGGVTGFDSVVWKVEDVSTPETPTLKLSYESVDGEEGYPGNLTVEVLYALTDDDVFEITYRATTDKPTVVNLTHHSYFHLDPSSQKDVLNHEVQIAASAYIPVDESIIPTGEINSVENSPFDFRIMKKIGDHINDQHVQLVRGKGYDHCWVIDDYTGDFKKIARVSNPTSGRVLEVLTTEPGVQFYTGNFLDGSLTGKNNFVYRNRTGLCLETQHFPDSPNQKNFPSVLLLPGEVFNSRTAYKFLVH